MNALVTVRVLLIDEIEKTEMMKRYEVLVFSCLNV